MGSQARGIPYPAWTALIPVHRPRPSGRVWPSEVDVVLISAAETKRLRRRVRNLGLVR